MEKRVRLASSLEKAVERCEPGRSPLSDRQFEEGHCVLDSALAAVGLLPVAGTSYQILNAAKKAGYLKALSPLSAPSGKLATTGESAIDEALTGGKKVTGANRYSDLEKRSSGIDAGKGNSFLARSGIQSQRPVTLEAVPSPPANIEIFEIQKVDGRSGFLFSVPEKLENGTWVKSSKEFLMDPITGGVDATSPAGRELFERLASSMAGRAHFAFIDVGSLGFVNKSFKAGDLAGDRYLKSVAEAILKNGEGKITLARTGGDEFGLIIKESDPAQVSRILSKIRESIKSDMKADAKKIFAEEKTQRAQEFKKSIAQFKKENPEFSPTELQELLKKSPDELRELAQGASNPEQRRALEQISSLKKPIHDISRTSVPDISIGTTQIGSLDDFSSLAGRAEDLAKTSKIESTLKQGRPASKYGDDRPPEVRPDFRFRSDIQTPAVSPSWNQVASDMASAPKNLEGLRPMSYTRSREVVRVGDSTVAEYTDELGRVTFRSERYVINPLTHEKVGVLTDIPLRGSSGLLDGMHPESQYLIVNHFKKNQDTILVMPKLRSLKYLNYFENGTQAGDEVISVVGELLKKQARSQTDLAFKMNGADFLWSAQGISKSNLQSRFSEISRQLEQHPRIVELLKKEKLRLEKAIDLSQKAGQKADVKRYQEQLHRVQNFKFDLQFDTLTHGEVKTNATVADIQKQFDQKFKNRFPDP